MITMIVAINKEGIIGVDNKIPWKSKEDMVHFKKTTIGHPVIVGKRTFEGFGSPLKGRTNIVLTSKKNKNEETVKYASSIEESILVANKHVKDSDKNEIFVIGGKSVYESFLEKDLIDKVILSRIGLAVEVAGEKMFYDLEKDETFLKNFELCSQEPKIDFVLAIYERKNK